MLEDVDRPVPGGAEDLHDRPVRPAAVQEVLVTAILIYAIAAIGWLLFRALDAIIATLDALAKKYASSR